MPFCKRNIKLSKGNITQEILYSTGAAPAQEGSIFVLDKPMIDYDFIRFDWLAAVVGDISKSINVSTWYSPSWHSNSLWQDNEVVLNVTQLRSNYVYFACIQGKWNDEKGKTITILFNRRKREGQEIADGDLNLNKIHAVYGYKVL